MADKQQFFDVFIVETNTGYRKVPYSIVADWLQEGRLLGEDKVAVSGTNKYARIESVRALAAFLPRPVPQRAEDKAEALEALHSDFGWKGRRGDEEEDVDMIPLIDVSLVLLIFFMMTSTAISTAASSINTPSVLFPGVTIVPDMLWIGIDRGADGQPAYSLGKGEKPGEDYPNRQQVLRAFEDKLKAEPNEATVRIRAHRELPYDVVRSLMIELERFRRPRGKVVNILAEVSEKQTK